MNHTLTICLCFFLITVSAFLFPSCGSESNSQSKGITYTIAPRETLQHEHPNKPGTPKTIEKQQQAATKRIDSEPTPTRQKAWAMDTTVYYYKNSRSISLLITPWKEGRRQLLFYDPFGSLTYSITDKSTSYTSETKITAFHDNGAVASLTITLYPDASMYWYSTNITFGINNEPLWKEDFQHPEEQTTIPENAKSYWKNGTWHKQEMAIEQPYKKE